VHVLAVLHAPGPLRSGSRNPWQRWPGDGAMLCWLCWGPAPLEGWASFPSQAMSHALVWVGGWVGVCVCVWGGGGACEAEGGVGVGWG